jgi:hypothetical protein
MALVINATEENITIQVGGNYFTWKPAQEKRIQNESIANFIATSKRGCGLAVLPDLTSLDEDNGDIEVTEEQMTARRTAMTEAKKNALRDALDAYVAAKREVIKNNQVSLARDLARADYKYGPEHEMTDGELDAMRLVAKYERKGKDASEDRLKEIDQLKKKIAGK